MAAPENPKTSKRAPGSIARSIKLGVVGDGTVGKTTLLVSYTCQAFLDDYVPTLFDNFSAIEEVDGVGINVILWDTAGQEDYAHLRTTCYQNTDVFLLCFSTVHLDSFDNLKHKWLQELKANVPETPFLLVGTKTDVRAQKIAENKDADVITQKKGQKRAKEIKAVNYVECSAKDLPSVNSVFIEAIKTVLNREKKIKDKERKEWKKEEEKERKEEEKAAKAAAKAKAKAEKAPGAPGAPGAPAASSP